MRGAGAISPTFWTDKSIIAGHDTSTVRDWHNRRMIDLRVAIVARDGVTISWRTRSDTTRRDVYTNYNMSLPVVKIDINYDDELGVCNINTNYQPLICRRQDSELSFNVC